jgi:hypothetical protein
MRNTKEITKTLHSFIDEKFIKNHIFPFTRFSTKSNKFLTQLFELMFEANHLLPTIDIKIQHIVDEENIPKSFDHNYIPSASLKVINSMKKEAYLYSFKLKDREHRDKHYQTLFIYPINSEYNEKMFTKRIHKVIMWLYIANVFASQECSQEMNIFMYFTNSEKHLPTNSKFIGQEHANTAFTTSCKKTTEINLYREEEWFKVFIHETFHNLGLDFSSMIENLSKNAILSIFPVESEVNLYETYCEMWAEIMNIMFIVFLSNKNIENLENIPTMIHKTEQLLHFERAFSLFQCVKVLHFYGLTYTELYDDSNKSKLARKYKFKEKRTNVLAYYILKSIYMFYVNDFIEWCIKNNKESINFKKDEKTIHSYCEFIREHYNDDSLLHAIDKIEKWFQHNNKCNIECTTMRMTLYEST